MKKLFATRLRERTDTIEFRAIKKQCMNIAQNRGTCMLRLTIQPATITMLENELLTVEKINEHGYETYKISW